MTDGQLVSFGQLLGRIGGVFGKRADDIAQLAPSYFRALKPFDYDDVARAADALTASEQHFPRPARWIQAIKDLPRGEALLVLPTTEIREWLDAERRGFEGAPCGCGTCREAGVEDRPTRFVPVEPPDRRVLDRRSVLRGRWIHGWDLARWYQARADCYEVMLRVKAGHPLRDLLETL